MSAGIQADRKSFHRRQMSALPTLLPGLDPDPPVLLCAQTAKYDETIQAELRRRGWPGTSRAKKDAEANAPTPIKSAVLARKIAKGSRLTVAETELIADRIAWLMRNAHRWNARNGYASLAAAKREQTRATVASSVSAESEGSPASAAAAPASTSGSQHDASTQDAPSRAARAVDELAPALAENPDLQRGARTTKSPTNGRDESTLTRECDAVESQASKGFGGSEQIDRLEAAKRSLADLTDAAEAKRNIPSSRPGPVSANPARKAVLTKPKCRSIKDIPSQKAKAFLFAILYGHPREKIERLGEALVADQTELTAALSGPNLGRQDIRNACAELGLELPC